MKKVIALTLVLMLLLLTGCGAASQDPAPVAQTPPADQGSSTVADGYSGGPSMDMIINTVWSPTHYQTEGLKKFAALVDERTNGDITMTVEPGAALGYTGPDILRAVRDGLLPVSEFVLSGVEGDELLYGIHSIPFMLEDFDDAYLFHEVSLPYFQELAEAEWNQKILYISPWPFSCLWSKREVKSIDDMAGLKCRTYDKNGALFMEDVDAVPLVLPFSEVYSSLATNLIDSVLTSPPTAVEGSFWEVLDYYQPMRITLSVSAISINLDYFNDMSAEQQQILIDTAKEIETEMWVKAQEEDERTLKVSTDNGIEIIPVSDEFAAELKERGKPFLDSFFETTPVARDIYEEFLAAKG